MRLIDADLFKQLISTIATESKFDTEGTHACLELIDKQPTAFDVDTVVKELEEKISDARRIMVPEIHDELDRIANSAAEDFIMAYEDAIEIIRKGGAVDTNVGDKWIPCSERLAECERTV